jgi:hypothetical protein
MSSRPTCPPRSGYYNGNKQPGFDPDAKPSGRTAHSDSRGPRNKKKASVLTGATCCDRCQAKKADGSQCSRSTCSTGPYCWQHTQKYSKAGLRVKKSGEPGAGKGLYITKSVKRGQTIGPYNDNKTASYTRAQMERLAPGDTRVVYGFQQDKGGRPYKNAYRTNDPSTRYINEARRKRRPNTKFENVGDTTVVKALHDMRISGNTRQKELLIKYNRPRKKAGAKRVTRSRRK